MSLSEALDRQKKEAEAGAVRVVRVGNFAEGSKDKTFEIPWGNSIRLIGQKLKERSFSIRYVLVAFV